MRDWAGHRNNRGHKRKTTNGASSQSEKASGFFFGNEWKFPKSASIASSSGRGSVSCVFDWERKGKGVWVPSRNFAVVIKWPRSRGAPPTSSAPCHGSPEEHQANLLLTCREHQRQGRVSTLTGVSARVRSYNTPPPVRPSPHPRFS